LVKKSLWLLTMLIYHRTTLLLKLRNKLAIQHRNALDKVAEAEAILEIEESQVAAEMHKEIITDNFL
jgi:hypothetical protein